MHAIDDPEVKRHRLIGSAVRTVIAFGLIAGLAAIGTNAPTSRPLTLTCAYDPAATGTLSDAPGDVSALCADPATKVAKPAAHVVPDAATALDKGRWPEQEFDPHEIPSTF